MLIPQMSNLLTLVLHHVNDFHVRAEVQNFSYVLALHVSF